MMGGRAVEERARTDVLSTQSTSEPDVVNGISESMNIFAPDACAVQVGRVRLLRTNGARRYISPDLKIRSGVLALNDHLIDHHSLISYCKHLHNILLLYSFVSFVLFECFRFSPTPSLPLALLLAAETLATRPSLRLSRGHRTRRADHCVVCRGVRTNMFTGDKKCRHTLPSPVLYFIPSTCNTIPHAHYHETLPELQPD